MSKAKQEFNLTSSNQTNMITTQPQTHCDKRSVQPNNVLNPGTDIFGYSDTGYSDTPIRMTVLVNPMSPKRVTVSKYLLTVTLFPCP